MPFGLLCSIIIDELRLLTLSITAGNVLASSSRWTSGSSHLGHRRQVQFRRSGSGHVFGCVQLQEPDALGDVLVVERPPRLHVLPAPEEQAMAEPAQPAQPAQPEIRPNRFLPEFEFDMAAGDTPSASSDAITLVATPFWNQDE